MLYVALLRGVNVGGNNKVSMAALRECLENLGCEKVRTYINSGNVIFDSDKTANVITKEIGKALPAALKLSQPIKILVISRKQLEEIVAKAPPGFGQKPATYHSDVAFLIDISSAGAMEQIEVNPEVDTAWPGDGVVYYQRLSAKRTKSRLPKIVGKSIYKSMTIRSWSTVRKLMSLVQDVAAK